MARKFADLKAQGQTRKKRSNVRDEPYVVELEDGSTITVPYPDAQVTMALGKVDQDDVASVLRILFSSNPRDYNRLLEELDGEPAETLYEFIEDMWLFWKDDKRSSAGKLKG